MLRNWGSAKKNGFLIKKKRVSKRSEATMILL